jgi:hypothetical protein
MLNVGAVSELRNLFGLFELKEILEERKNKLSPHSKILYFFFKISLIQRSPFIFILISGMSLVSVATVCDSRSLPFSVSL